MNENIIEEKLNELNSLIEELKKQKEEYKRLIDEMKDFKLVLFDK